MYSSTLYLIKEHFRISHIWRHGRKSSNLFKRPQRTNEERSSCFYSLMGNKYELGVPKQ